MNHKAQKRIVRRLQEELFSTLQVAHVLGVRAAYQTLLGKIDLQLIVRNGRIERPRYRRHLQKKHEALNRYFAKTCPLPQSCRDAQPPAQNEADPERIWTCWWQGLDHAPPLVKQCVASIRRNAGGREVVVITEENVRQFVQFPPWLEEKYQNGILSRTHLSDILRLKLLAQYGGVWLDATFFCTAPLESCFSVPVWSIKRPGYRYTSVAAGNFANYSFGCKAQSRRVFAVLAEYALAYWKTHDYMVDYLFLDYLIVQAQAQDRALREAFQAIPPNNPACDELLKVLGKPYDAAVWDRLKRDTALFKLTWKTQYPVLAGGAKTFYGKLIAGELV